MVTDPPAGTTTALALTRYCVGEPLVSTMGAACPLTDPLLAVMTWTVPATPLVVNETTAKPLPFVRLVGVPKVPPFVVAHVTTWFGVATGFPNASVNCALIVTASPAIVVVALDVTTYFAAGPAMVTIGGVLPTIDPFVAVTTCDAPATVLGVNVTVATPFPFVLVFGDEKLPPPVLDQFTVWPGVAR